MAGARFQENFHILRNTFAFGDKELFNIKDFPTPILLGNDTTSSANFSKYDFSTNTVSTLTPSISANTFTYEPTDVNYVYIVTIKAEIYKVDIKNGGYVWKTTVIDGTDGICIFQGILHVLCYDVKNSYYIYYSIDPTNGKINFERIIKTIPSIGNIYHNPLTFFPLFTSTSGSTALWFDASGTEHLLINMPDYICSDPYTGVYYGVSGSNLVQVDFSGNTTIVGSGLFSENDYWQIAFSERFILVCPHSNTISDGLYRIDKNDLTTIQLAANNYYANSIPILNPVNGLTYLEDSTYFLTYDENGTLSYLSGSFPLALDNALALLYPYPQS